MAAIEGNQIKFTDGNSIKGDLLLTDGLLVDTDYGTFKLEVTPEQINFIDFSGEMKRKHQAAEIDAGMAKIGFKNGTVIVGELRNLDLTVKTKYGALRPTLVDVASVTDTLVTLKDGDSLKGDVDFGSERLVVKTAFGAFTVDAESGDIAFVDFTGEIAPAGTEGKQVNDKKVVEFVDDFARGPHPDWKSAIGNWTMANGMYTVINIQDDTQYITFLDNKVWTNLILTVDVKPGDTSNAATEATICPRMLNADNGVCVLLWAKNGEFYGSAWRILKDGNWSEAVGKAEIKTPKGEIVHIKIEIKDHVFTAYLNDSQFSQIYDNTFPSGSIGFSQWYNRWYRPQIRVAFDNLKVTPLE